MDHPKAISAPGVNIYSTIPTNQVCGKTVCDLPYDYKNGTSMAAPVVAGTLALIKSSMYDDYVKVIKEVQKKNPNIPLFTFYEFFHSKQKESMNMLGLAITPSSLAEQLLFSYTNKDNDYLRNQQSMVYGAKRDPVFGFGRVDIGEAVKGSSQVFSSVFLK